MTPENPQTDAEFDARTATLLRSVVAGHRADGTPEPADPQGPAARALLERMLATPAGAATSERHAATPLKRPDERPEARPDERPGVRPVTPAASRPATRVDSGPASRVDAGPASRVDSGPSSRGGSRPASGSGRARIRPLGRRTGPRTGSRAGSRVGRRALLALGALVLAAALGVAGLASPQQAFATWTSTPTHISDDRALATITQCRDDLLRGGDWPGADGAPSRAQVEGLTLVIAERRGRNTFGVLAGDGWMMDCLATDSWLPFTGVGGSASGLSPIPRGQVPANGLGMVWQSGSMTSGLGTSASFESVVAQVGSQVRSVRLQTQRGPVQASVAGGFAAAWWPVDGDPQVDSPVSATLTLTDGRTVEVPDVTAAGADYARRHGAS